MPVSNREEKTFYLKAKVEQYRIIFHLLLLAVAISISYSNTLNTPFHFDDTSNIVNEKNIRLTSLDWTGIQRSFYQTDPYSGIEKPNRPLARLTFALNYFFGQLDVRGFHFVNITIHILASFFLYLLFSEFLWIIHCRFELPFFEQKYIPDLALLAACLWALHPLQIQAVTYIVQRMASLAGMFYFLAFYLYLKGRFSIKHSRKVVFFVFAGFIWGCALFSKENAILLVPSILAFEYTLSGIKLSRRQLFYSGILLAILLIVSTVMYFLFFAMIDNLIADIYAKRPWTIWERLLTESRVLITYITLIFNPTNTFLSLDKEIAFSTSLISPPSTILAIAAILGLLWGALYYRFRYPLLSYAIFFFFINHLIESTIIPLELYFEHRNYIPSIFLYLCLAFLFLSLLNYWKLNKRRVMVYVFAFLIFFFIASEGVATYLRNDYWRSEIALLIDDIEKNPTAIRQKVNLAVRYIREKKYELAKKYLKEAEHIYKTNPDRAYKQHVGLLYFNAGVLHHLLGNKAKAKRLYLRSLDFVPTSQSAQVNLACLYFIDGNFDTAEKALHNALIINDTKPLLYNMLANIYYANNKLPKALAALQKGLGRSKQPIMQLNLVSTHIAMGNIAVAERKFSQIQEEKSLMYYLLQAFLADEQEQKSALKDIAKFLIQNKISYTFLIESILTQNNLGYIFPEIDHFEKNLANTYIDLLAQKKEVIDNTIDKINTYY